MLEDLSFSPLKLAHTKSSLLSLWSYVSRHHVVKRDDFLLLIWKFAHAQCLHCAVQCHYSFFFFPFMPDSWYSFKTCLWWAQQGTKESFERNFNMKKNALTFFFLFNIAWTLPAYAHAQNCPTRLTMYHLFSLDPIVDLFTNIKCLQANPSCCMFAAYCGR